MINKLKSIKSAVGLAGILAMSGCASFNGSGDSGEGYADCNNIWGYKQVVVGQQNSNESELSYLLGGLLKLSPAGSIAKAALQNVAGDILIAHGSAAESSANNGQVIVTKDKGAFFPMQSQTFDCITFEQTFDQNNNGVLDMSDMKVKTRIVNLNNISSFGVNNLIFNAHIEGYPGADAEVYFYAVGGSQMPVYQMRGMRINHHSDLIQAFVPISELKNNGAVGNLRLEWRIKTRPDEEYGGILYKSYPVTLCTN